MSPRIFPSINEIITFLSNNRLFSCSGTAVSDMSKQSSEISVVRISITRHGE